MTFYSPGFIFGFLPIFVVLYALLGSKLRSPILFFGSIVFYWFASGGAIMSMAVILSTLLFNYAAGLFIGIAEGRMKKVLFSFCTVIDAAALLSPKVMAIISDSFSASLPDSLVIAAPIGFSFYIFKNMSYLRQVYDGKIESEQSFFAIGAYLLNFAQVLSGPIQTYADFKKSRAECKVSLASINGGLYEFIIGLALKILLADRIIRVWTAGLYGINSIGVDSISTPLAWLGFFAFPLYLYFEFYGYSLMSRGIGMMLGYETPDNFLYPYISRSVSEFWRRWHMTLGEWFKENIYFPLGGSRCSVPRTLFNLTVVWLCTGVWHALCFDGNGVNFMLWAAFLLFFILLEKLEVLKFITENKILSHIYLPIVILFSWMIFNTNLPTLGDLGAYVSRLFAVGELPEYVNANDWIVHVKDVGIFMAAGVIFLTPWPRNIYEKLKANKFISILLMLVLFWISVYFIFCEGANPMVY
ncbi:MAG: MBOAT family protein [Clostridia bacterium]|nr:MBOAT family protein [Clostridia bacterium]